MKNRCIAVESWLSRVRNLVMWTDDQLSLLITERNRNAKYYNIPESSRVRKMTTNPISLKCLFPDDKRFNIEVCKEDKIAMLKHAVEGLLKNQDHQDSDLYVIIPKNSIAKMFDYFKNGTFDPNQIHIIVKPKE
ncbi:1450_t:CDS:2 [Cetraspora pellucida]|uniref:1450_t:CDS:1 n=1 Tax=Cetraspora pellucida TaxID=1433469 RepID=A0A9N9BGL5_9GLOM|nr:1450_t:CDS:2 [Cetraspora pellucida]